MKEENRFKKTFVCFKVDHFWGNYEIIGDTIKFYYDNVLEENKRDDYAIMQIINNTTDKSFGFIHYHSESLREEEIPMIILELKREKLY